MTPTTTSRRRRTTKPENPETREIVRITMIRRKIYKNFHEWNVSSKTYKDLIGPLRTFPKADFPKVEKKFYNASIGLEKALKGVSLRGFSYEDVKSAPRTVNPVFSTFENNLKSLHRAYTIPDLDRSKLNKLFSAQTTGEFEANLQNPSIIPSSYKIKIPAAKLAILVAKAKAVHKHIMQYRKYNAKKITREKSQKYIDEIFRAKNRGDLSNNVTHSTTIDKSLISNDLFNKKIVPTWEIYLTLKNKLTEQQEITRNLKAKKNNILNQPVEYMRKTEHYVAKNIQKIRENWGSMEPKERVVAGLTLLIGTAYLLNSKKAEVVKIRDLLAKAGMVAIGYYGASTTMKALTGRSLTNRLGTWADRKSGKLDYLKDGLGLKNNTEADLMNSAIVALWNEDAHDVLNKYLKDKKRQKHKDPRIREMIWSGFASQHLSTKQLYKALHLLDTRTLGEMGGIKGLLKEIDKAQKGSKTRLTFGQVMVGILHKRNLKLKVEKGKFKISLRNVDVEWDPAHKNVTKAWWIIAGKPKDWRMGNINYRGIWFDDVLGNGKYRPEFLKKISKYKWNKNKPLSEYITSARFNRFTTGFKKVYEKEYKDNKQKNIHKYKEGNTMFIMSKVKIDYPSFRGRPLARSVAVEKAYSQALLNLTKQYKNHPRIKHIIHDLSKIVQPVNGVFLAQPRKDPLGVEVPGSSTHYVMFLRMTLPSSLEYDLRSKDLWTNGNMIDTMKNKEDLASASDPLTIADFKAYTRVRKPIMKIDKGIPRLAGFNYPYRGMYERFLANFGLTKNPGDQLKATAIFNYYSKKHSNVITKKGLAAYLASIDHASDFNYKKLEKIYSECGITKNKDVFNDSLNIGRRIIEVTTEAMDKLLKALKKKKKERDDATNIRDKLKLATEVINMKKRYSQLKEIVPGRFDAMVSMALYGDVTAKSILAKAPLVGPAIKTSLTVFCNPSTPVAKKKAQLDIILPLYKKIITESLTKATVYNALEKSVIAFTRN